MVWSQIWYSYMSVIILLILFTLHNTCELCISQCVLVESQSMKAVPSVLCQLMLKIDQHLLAMFWWHSVATWSAAISDRSHESREFNHTMSMFSTIMSHTAVMAVFLLCCWLVHQRCMDSVKFHPHPQYCHPQYCHPVCSYSVTTLLARTTQHSYLLLNFHFHKLGCNHWPF